VGEEQGDACSADGADEAGDASAKCGGPLGFEDEKGGHGQPVAVADVEVAIDGGAEQQRDGHADGVGGGVAGEVDLVAEADPELAGAGLEAGEEWWSSGFGFGGGVKDEVVEEGVDEHYEGAAEQDHGGASDGEVQAELEVAGDDDIDAALLAHPTGGGAEGGEDAVVEGRDGDEEKDEPGVVRAERAYERGGGDAEGEQPHAEQAGGEGFVEDSEADAVGGTGGDGTGAFVSGKVAEQKSDSHGDDGGDAGPRGTFGPGESGGVGRDVEEAGHAVGLSL